MKDCIKDFLPLILVALAALGFVWLIQTSLDEGRAHAEAVRARARLVVIEGANYPYQVILDRETGKKYLVNARGGNPVELEAVPIE